MRLMLSIAFAMLFAVSAVSCKSSKDSGKETVSANADLIVSFFSPGNGIDGEMLRSFTDFLKESHPNVSYSRVKWGKEGEVDLCFDLSKMKSDKDAFIEEVKTFVSNSERVRVKIDQPCREAR